jgi:hypothetical protein
MAVEATESLCLLKKPIGEIVRRKNEGIARGGRVDKDLFARSLILVERVTWGQIPEH